MAQIRIVLKYNHKLEAICMNGWLKAERYLPAVGAGWERFSENVHVKLKSGKVIKGFYDTKGGRWYNYDTRREISNEDVVEWKLMKP